MGTETITANAIKTRTNSHRLFGNGTVCNPTKLPKGELFVEGDEYEVTTTVLDRVTREVKSVSTHMARRTVVCNKCNKVDHRGLR